MLRTRLWMGSLLVAFVVAVVVLDTYLGRYPFLFLLIVLALAELACLELLHLLDGPRRPVGWLCFAGVALVLLANLPAHLGGPIAGLDRDPWHWVVGAFTAVVLGAFLVEMARFHGPGANPGDAVARLALAVWVVAYAGLLPSFLVEIRWPFAPTEETLARFHELGILGLVLAIFVPKVCDIGAYFTGRFLGRHRMAPVLSPKKTWEGAAGGLAAAVGATIGLNRLGSTPHALPGLAAEIGFGLSVGVAGMLGDLAESLVKRDCGRKDASQAVPGFGGVLDVVDAIVFAAPVAYAWLHRSAGA